MRRAIRPGVGNVGRCPATLSCSPFHSKSQDSSEALPVTPRQRVTIADILERRAKAGRLVAGTAAYSDADMFKAPVR